MRFLWTFCASLLWVTSARAQAGSPGCEEPAPRAPLAIAVDSGGAAGTARVRVFDGTSGTLLTGLRKVLLRPVESGDFVVSDTLPVASGFRFVGLQRGRYLLIARGLGYHSRWDTLVVDRGSLEVEVRLKRAPLDACQVEVLPLSTKFALPTRRPPPA